LKIFNFFTFLEKKNPVHKFKKNCSTLNFVSHRKVYSCTKVYITHLSAGIPHRDSLREITKNLGISPGIVGKTENCFWVRIMAQGDWIHKKTRSKNQMLLSL